MQSTRDPDCFERFERAQGAGAMRTPYPLFAKVLAQRREAPQDDLAGAETRYRCSNN